MNSDRPAPELKTATLDVRRLRVGDGRALTELWATPRFFVLGESTQERPCAVASEKLIDEQLHVQPGTGGQTLHCAILPRGAAGFFAGECSLAIDAIDHRQVELYARLRPEFARAAELSDLLATLLGYCLKELGKNKLKIYTDTCHSSAKGLLEDFGFVCEGHFLENARSGDLWHDQFLFSMLAADWQTPQRSRYCKRSQASSANNAM